MRCWWKRPGQAKWTCHSLWPCCLPLTASHLGNACAAHPAQLSGLKLDDGLQPDAASLQLDEAVSALNVASLVLAASQLRLTSPPSQQPLLSWTHCT